MLIPTLTVPDMAEAIAFYTRVLDFTLASTLPEESPFYAVLTRGKDELHLSLPSGQGGRRYGTAIVLCDDVDARFSAFRSRGLAATARPDSPVHEAPLDQSWGTREVYIDDPAGNTLIYQQR